MLRWALIIAALALLVGAAFWGLESQLHRLTLIIVGTCLALWLSEAVPPFVPTLLLWALIPLLLGPLDDKFSLAKVLTWAVNPVLALFLGGFALGLATQRYGLDQRLARAALRAAGTSWARLLFLVMFLTAFLSMWMSNVAAAALMLACLQPMLPEAEEAAGLRRALLVGVALGADLGGIATPIGTGPNGIAIAAVAPVQKVSFLAWMAFAVPLAAGMLCLGFALLWWRGRRESGGWPVLAPVLTDDSAGPRPRGEIGFLLLFGATVLLWLTEPAHGIPAAVVSLAATSLLFLTNLLTQDDLARIDWATLLLIAGGITLGMLLEQTGLLQMAAGHISLGQANPTVSLLALCLVSAILVALMSNTATVVLLIPLAQAILPQPSTAILVALAASFGIPFVISTPPNAMAYGAGGMRAADLFWPGIVLMLVGCLLISLTGRFVLHLVGIP